jgi:hypothetical protein
MLHRNCIPPVIVIIFGSVPAFAAPPAKVVPAEDLILVAKLNFKDPTKVLEVLDPAGKTRGHLDLGQLTNVQRARVSPDGKRLAIARFIPLSGADPNSRGKYAYPQDIYVVELPLVGPPKEPTIKGVIDLSVAWASDGQSLFVSGCPADADVGQNNLRDKMVPRKTIRYDLATKTEKPVAIPVFHAVQDVTPDGKTLLTKTKVWGPNLIRFSTYLVPLDTLKPKLVGKEDDGFDQARFSPDGTKVLGTRMKFTKSTDLGLFVHDVAKGTAAKVPMADEIAGQLLNGTAVWSPDGKRVAVLWEEQVAGPGPVGGGGGGARAKRITVCDANGANAKTIREFQSDEYLLHIEWAAPRLGELSPDKER